jgi:hypothetical protein
MLGVLAGAWVGAFVFRTRSRFNNRKSCTGVIQLTALFGRLYSLKLRLFSPANPETTAVKASSLDALRGGLLYAALAPMMEPVAIQVHLDLFTARRNASGP